MLSLWVQHFMMAFQELKGNKLRTSLSLLGITIGVFCIISVLTIFDSLQRNIENSMESLGSKVIYVSKFAWIPEEKGEYPMWKYKARPASKRKDLVAIQNTVNGAKAAALSYNTQAPTLSYMDNTISQASISAITNDYNKVQPIEIAKGRYFSLQEMSGSQSNTLVIGHAIAQSLFPKSVNPIGKSVKMLGRHFTIIGVIQRQGKSMSGFDSDNSVLMSYQYLQAIRNIESESGDAFNDPLLMIRVKDKYDMQECKYEIKAALRASRKLAPGEPDNFSLNELSTIQNAISAIFVNFNIFGWIIGLFSLLVGTFGIANIMFVSVRERTPFIGLKKAIGATAHTIRTEFLIESVLLCILGGLIGILLVYILTFVLSGPLGFPVFLSINNFTLGIIISIVTGVVAGYLPAQRASLMNPVEAIRS